MQASYINMGLIMSGAAARTGSLEKINRKKILKKRGKRIC